MPQTVLIVDDEPHIVEALKFLMEQDGYDVFTSYDGEKALALVAKIKPDLIILDIMLPGIDGYEICEIVRLNPDWRGSKIIFLTAKGGEEDIARGVVLGADAYITKPFSNRALVEKVRQLMAVSG